MIRQKGFTIIELLTVIAIIGILLAVVRPMLSTSSARTREFACESNLRQVSMVMRAYADDYGAFPKDLKDLDNAVGDSDVLRCPRTGSVYYYASPAGAADRDRVVMSCINPRSKSVWPHKYGQCYLALTAGGGVRRIMMQRTK